MSKVIDKKQEIVDPSGLVDDLEKLRQQNASLQKKINKKEKWIEKDERLANKQRVGRLVTKNDIDDPAFMKKYPNARIGDEFNDPEPLFWKVGLKRRPTLEQQHAQIAAQFAHDFREDMEGGVNFLDDREEPDEEFTEGEIQAFLHQSSLQDANAAEKKTPEADKNSLPPPAKQSVEDTNGGEATAKQTQKNEGGE
jgi:hypothetical protein